MNDEDKLKQKLFKAISGLWIIDAHNHIPPEADRLAMKVDAVSLLKSALAMKPRERVSASIERKNFDRLPIKHLAVGEIDEMLCRHFGVDEYNELLDALGNDFRDVGPRCLDPDLAAEGEKYGDIAAVIWNRFFKLQRPGVEFPLSEISTMDDLARFEFPEPDLYDYSVFEEQCRRYDNYARMLGYCALDFLNGLGNLRGFDRLFLDIGLRDPVFLELVERRFWFMYEYLKCSLEAAKGQIDLIHLADDLGSQEGLLLSPSTFLELFGDKYREVVELGHRHGAKIMMHVCGSIAGIIPTLIDLGLDVLDVVQTNAVGMDLTKLKREFGGDLTFSGTMCVQKVIPFGTPAEVREEVRKTLDLFSEGGLIIGPSHQLQVDSPLENILEMYRTAGGLS